jgi:hypothetical protein
MVTAAAWWAAACVEDGKVAAPERRFGVRDPMTYEGEVIGNVYESGQPTTRTDL